MTTNFTLHLFITQLYTVICCAVEEREVGVEVPEEEEEINRNE